MTRPRDHIAQKHARMQCTYIIVLEMYIFDTDEAFQKVREDMPKILSALFDVMLMIHWHFLMKLSSYKTMELSGNNVRYLLLFLGEALVLQ